MKEVASQNFGKRGVYAIDDAHAHAHADKQEIGIPASYRTQTST